MKPKTDDEIYSKVVKKYGDFYFKQSVKYAITLAKEAVFKEMIKVFDNHKIDYSTSRKRDIQSLKYKIEKHRK